MEDTADTLPPSKTQRKQEMDALQAIGAELIALNDHQLASIPLPESLRDAVSEARRLRTFEAQRRQLQYIGKLMRYVDPAPIRHQLDGWRSVSAEHTARLHRMEHWRDRLLNEPAALAEFIDTYPSTNIQQLRLLIRNTAYERTNGKPPKNFRALFQLIRELVQAQEAPIPEVDPANHNPTESSENIPNAAANASLAPRSKR